MQSRIRVPVTFGLLVLAGCLPEKRIVWSPDGSRAVVFADQDIRLASPDGKLSEPLLKGFGRAAWFPDNRRIFLIKSDEVSHWSDIEPTLSEADREMVVRIAEALREKVKAYSGDWNNFKPAYDFAHTDGQAGAAMMYLRDKLSEGLPEKIGEKWTELEKLTITLYRLEIVTIDGDRMTEGPLLATTLDNSMQPSVSPKGTHVAFLQGTPGSDQDKESDSMDLMALATDRPGLPHRMLQYVAYGYGWSPDGQSLAVIRSPSAPSKELRLGAVATVQLVDAAGSLIDSNSIKVEDHAGLLFNQFGCVRWMSDGRLIFSSHEVTLPATEQEMPKHWSLYAWSPAMRAGTTRVLARGAETDLSADLALFDISPDGRRAVMNGENGRVVIADLTTGELSMWFDTIDPDNGPRSLPGWRNNEEVCVVVPPGSPAGNPDRCEVILATDAQHARSLSRKWPGPKAGFNWMEPKPSQTSQPTTNP